MTRYLPFLRCLIAFACVVTGVAFWSIPAALVVAGVLLFVDTLT